MVGVGADRCLQVNPGARRVALGTGEEHPELEVGATVRRVAGQHLLLDRRSLVEARALAQEDAEVEEDPMVPGVDLARLSVCGLSLSRSPQLLESDREVVPGGGGEGLAGNRRRV